MVLAADVGQILLHGFGDPRPLQQPPALPLGPAGKRSFPSHALPGPVLRGSRPRPSTALTRTSGAPSGPARARAQSRGSRVRPGPAARGGAPAAAAPSPTRSAARLALRGTQVRARAPPPVRPPPVRPAGARTSLQQAADGAGMLRQERGPRHREQQLPGLHALPGHHAVAGHRALPAHRHLKGSSGSEQARAQPARVSAPPRSPWGSAPAPRARTNSGSRPRGPGPDPDRGRRHRL